MAASAAAQESFGRALDLHRAGRLDEAAALYRTLSAGDNPFSVDARINLGAILHEGGRPEEAELLYREALSLRGADPVALNNLGNTLMALGRFAEAAGCFRGALQSAPDCREARLALGAALQREGDLPGAIACFRDLLAREPDCAEAHWNLSLALLQVGEFPDGWREYQWRWRRDSFTSPRRDFDAPLWDGSPLFGRSILVHGEQGLGDTIQFLRYLPMVAGAGGTVFAECQSASLLPLVRRIPGVAAAFVMGDQLPPCDLQVPLLSLPFLFGTTLENIPAQVPYLSAPPEQLARWSARAAGPDGFRVGLVWRGKPVPDPFRSCTLEALAPLGAVPGVQFYSLQVGEGAAQALTPPAGLELIDLTGEIRDFGDTAALVATLDLVISVDTSVAHLAAALGKPVWLLLPKAGDYRWLLDREDSPWYPGLRIFRQEHQGEWGGVVGRINWELKNAVMKSLELAAAREPLNGWRMYLCGVYLAGQDRHREAIGRFSKASLLNPGNWEPHYGLAGSQQYLGLLAEAEQSLLCALQLRDDLALLHEALGVTRQMQGDLAGAIASYLRAVALDPDALKSRYNLATACRESGRYREALAEYREVIRLAPGHADARWNLALLLLLNGELAEGWQELSWRFCKSAPAPVARWQDRPHWDGSEPAGRTILLYGEQGLGDTLQFIRYAPLLAARGASVLVEVQSAALASLVDRVEGVTRVLIAGEAPPPFDLQASLFELPALFGTQLDSIPAQIPYLQADPARLARARDLLPQDGFFKVGVVWGGSRGHQNDANRSIPAEMLAPLADIPGVRFYALQLGEAASEAARVPALELTDLSQGIGDFSDTAALAAQLDLILTVDTSVAHLCGGLGLPVWVMLPFVPDWRWLLEREDSPWYPTLRLFRQQAPGAWEGVVLRVRDELAAAVTGIAGLPKSVGSAGCPGVVATAAASSSEPHRSRGIALSEQSRFSEAAREFERALAAAPTDVELLNNLGCAQDSAGRHLEAVASYARALSLKDDFLAPHYNMGNSLRSLGRSAEAVECYRRALALEPSLAQGWHNLALSLQDLFRLDEAQTALERALELQPDYLEAGHNLGELFHARGELELAADCFRQVLAKNPDYLPSWNALGIALQVQGRLEEAAECYQRALSRDPDYLHALNNLGAVSRALGDLDRAVACYRRVLARDPDYADAHWNLSLVQLLLGDFAEGWQGYEWRFRKVDPIPLKEFPRPLWDGGSLKGRVILLHAEQGFGDTLQFVRYAGILAGMGGTVLVQCQSQVIAAVLATVPGVARVLVRGEALPEFDCHAPLMSLPLLCGTRLESIPAAIPYVSPEPGLVDQWRSKMQGRGLRVGLVWAGRKSYKDDLKRSLSLQLFAPLAGVAEVSFYALQVGEGAEQAASPPAGMELTDLGCGVRDFSDSAAIIAGLDLLISADTAVAHLAGALGKPVWVLLPKACDWRWLEQREDSPWYPSARLFRQARRGDWTEVLERVARALAQVAGPGGQPAPVVSDAPVFPEVLDGSVKSSVEEAQDRYAELNEALQGNRLEQAEQLCHKLLLASPDSVDLLTLAGALARQKGEPARALALFSRAAELNPALPELHNNLGVTLQDLGRPQEALASYHRALALRPTYCEASCNLGNTLRTLGRPHEAIGQYRLALAADAQYPEAYYNLGNALRAAGDWLEAVECYRNLLQLSPDHLSGWLNLGGSLIALNRFKEAIQAERRALELDSECVDAHWNLGLALLATGDYRQGWREYEWRLRDYDAFPATCAGRPMWDGSPLEGRTLLLRAEQGFGDALQFFRYAPLLARQGARVVVECRPELFPFFASQRYPGVQLFAVGQEPPHFDSFAYLMSLPFLLGTTLDSLPAAAPYLQADAALSGDWQKKMSGTGGLKIGVVWAGSAGYKNDRFRSLPLRLLVPLAQLPGAELYSLQLGDAAGELGELPESGIRDLGSSVRDFADTAAIIANLDLVVSVDTAVAHLAGALGKRVCLLLPKFCDWRWLSGRADSPWYPTLRLYRQNQAGDWETVLAALMSDLAPELQAKRAPRPEPELGQVLRPIPTPGQALQPRPARSLASAREPEDLNAQFRKANAHRCEGRPDEAMVIYHKLLELRPDCAEIYNNLGLALQDEGRLAEAGEQYRQALRLKPGLADAQNNLGTVLVSQDDREAAIPCFRAALSLKDDYLPAYVNLGSALQQLERPEEAIPLYRRAIDLQPHALEARINLGNAYQDLMQPERAIAVYQEALTIEPSSPTAHWNLALSLLSTGDFEKGWQEYEWRFEDGAPSPHPGPRWDGAELSGRNILLWCEQGLGDTLQFVRYAPLVAARGGRVLLCCQSASLKPLLERVPGVAAVFGPGEPLPPFQCHAPLLSLPRIFGTRLELMPATVPYLTPDPERVALWRGRMSQDAPFKVGLVWQGGPLPRNRACPFAEFAPLAELAGVTFFSLQLGHAPLPAVLPVIDLSEGIRDFADSAAIVANLDLVLTVDTACAHLAGGMGATVWTMLPKSCDWRWLAGRADSPWYPSMRIFRQEQSGDWQGVLRRIALALAEQAEKACK
jgi:tetratricopeptide (TPR) repeat protein